MSNEDNDHMHIALRAMPRGNSEDVDQDEDAAANTSGSSRGGKITSLSSKCQSHSTLHCKSSTSSAKAKVKECEETSSKPVEHFDDLPDNLFQKILSHLRFWEQSPCRLVNKRWNDQILNHSEYPQKSYILLNYERVTRTNGVADMLDDFDTAFRNVRMMRVPQFRIESCLSPAVTCNIVHLDLFHCGPFTWSTFLELLISCYRLEELRVRKCPFKWPYTADAEEWRNQYIEWQKRIVKAGNHFPDFKTVEFRVKDPHDVLYMFKLVSKYSTRLQRVSFSCKTPPQGLKLDTGFENMADDMYETVLELFDVIVEMVNKFATKLERFHSYLIDPCQQPRSNNNGAKTDATIINHFCSNVLGRLEWEDLHLKSFCLYGGEISADSIPKQTDILGLFLKSQTSLEKVILPRVKFPGAKEFEDFVRNISRTVKCIRVPAFGRMPDCLSFEFNRLSEYYVESHGTPDLQAIIPPGTILPNVRTFSFFNCSNWIWQTVKIMTIVNSFPCLTELLIRDDGTHQCTRIGDSDMQNICRYLPNLKKLHMTNVDCVTDFGFTGIFEKECKLMNETGTYVPSAGTKIGYSFSALSKLEYLFLSDIGFRVTNVSMIYGFVFQNLRFMTLEGYPKVTPWGVERLRRSNPLLKRWNVDFHDPNISQVVEQLQSFSNYRIEMNATATAAKTLKETDVEQPQPASLLPKRTAFLLLSQLSL